jgi:undecaprenyl-diphosphatase
VTLIEAATAVILGLVEGMTEFIPVSSTGHLIVAGELLGFTGPRASVFEVMIQLGAILSVVWFYRARFIGVARGLRTEPAAQRLVLHLFVAFLPAAIVGLLFHDVIKAVLFNPTVVAGSLVVGGVVMLLIERWKPRETVTDVDDMPITTALGVGLAQVLALVPGTSRSAATILGAYALGCSRKAAAEFSFFLAVPVMFAATGYDLLKSRALLSVDDLPFFALGFVMAFASALVVIKVFVAFVSRTSFVGFAWYRIVAGTALFYWLSRAAT